MGFGSSPFALGTEYMSVIASKGRIKFSVLDTGWYFFIRFRIPK